MNTKTKTQITHKRKRWMIFMAIVAVVWFKNQPSTTQPTQYALHSISVLIGSGLMYALFGRVLLWLWLGLCGFVAALAAPFEEASRNRREMDTITQQLMGKRNNALERRLRTPVIHSSEPAAPVAVPKQTEPRILN
jgi:hypothetical protein